jgi:1-deoxy-D-xylulose-5-phosphate reductoisomerase
VSIDVVILGSTGSIGVQALEIIAANPDTFRVVAVSAGSRNIPLLIEQAKKFSVEIVGTTAERTMFGEAFGDIEVIDGIDAASQIASIPSDIVLNAITGSIGLGPTLNALGVGNTVALANKESLVAGGDLVMAYGRDRIIPVDSEHSAIYQCVRSGRLSEVAKLILTASGGPFRDRDDLSQITVQEALKHPTWTMGEMVTINSATLVNKGLEIIEAHYLFGIPYKNIEAVIHPQSYIHSMVEYVDGSTLAQASPPSMKGPIAYALTQGERVKGAMTPIDWGQEHRWEFLPIDHAKFPAIDLARRCGELGGALPAIFNAANEVAVHAFLQEKLSFSGIMECVEHVVQTLGGGAPVKLRDLADVSAIEDDARRYAREYVA